MLFPTFGVHKLLAYIVSCKQLKKEFFFGPIIGSIVEKVSHRRFVMFDVMRENCCNNCSLAHYTMLSFTFGILILLAHQVSCMEY